MVVKTNKINKANPVSTFQGTSDQLVLSGKYKSKRSILFLLSLTSIVASAAWSEGKERNHQCSRGGRKGHTHI